MEELIGRLEKATEPDRDLDFAICGSPRLSNLDTLAPRYTSSIDAALSLMPEGYSCDTQTVLKGSAIFDKPKAWAQAEEINGPFIEDYAAPTLPLAICIVALKARANVSHGVESR